MRGDMGFPVRLRFSEHGKVRFISHRDVARAFERALRIEQAPLAFTQGFSPRPKMSFGLALSVGHESDAEYLDLELTEPVELDDFGRRLSASLPEGICLTGAAELVARAPALFESVSEVEYRMVVRDGEAAARDAVARGLECCSLPVARIRKGRQVVDDVREAIRDLRVLGEENGRTVLELAVATRPRSARPGDVLSAIGLADEHTVRTNQWIERDGARLEPLAADARRATEQVSAS